MLKSVESLGKGNFLTLLHKIPVFKRNKTIFYFSALYNWWTTEVSMDELYEYNSISQSFWLCTASRSHGEQMRSDVVVRHALRYTVLVLRSYDFAQQLCITLLQRVTLATEQSQLSRFLSWLDFRA